MKLHISLPCIIISFVTVLASDLPNNYKIKTPDNTITSDTNSLASTLYTDEALKKLTIDTKKDLADLQKGFVLTQMFYEDSFKYRTYSLIDLANRNITNTSIAADIDARIQKYKLASGPYDRMLCDLRNNQITSAGCRILKNTLMKNQALTILNLENNNIGDEGAHYLAEALKINSCFIGLWNTGVTKDTVTLFVKAIKMNPEIAQLIEDQGEVGDKTLIEIDMRYNNIESSPEIIKLANSLNKYGVFIKL